MHGPRRLRVPKVHERELKEVEDIEQQRPAKEAPAPEMNGSEREQIVRYEVRRQVAGVLDVRGRELGLRVEGCEVGHLQGVKDDPVDGYDGAGEGEGSVVVRVYAPDCAAVVDAFVGRGESVVDRRYHEEEVRESRGYSVSDDCVSRVFGARLEGVDCRGCEYNALFLLSTCGSLAS